MSDGYKGDTWVKKWVRNHQWIAVAKCLSDRTMALVEASHRRTCEMQKIVPRDESHASTLLAELESINADVAARVRNGNLGIGPVVFLASEHGGDVGCLLALGFEDTRLIGCDLDVVAVERAARRWPGIRIERGDVRSFVGPTTEAVSLDFCGPVSPVSVGIIEDVWRTLSDGAVVALTLQKGREGDRSVHLARPTVPRRKRLALRALRRSIVGAQVDDHLTSVDVAPRRTVVGARHQFIIDLLLRHCRELRCIQTVSYVSHHSPMFGLVVQKNVSTPLEEPFQMAWNKSHEAVVKEMIRQNVAIKGHDPRCYNVSLATAAAWRAHATRGTYS